MDLRLGFWPADGHHLELKEALAFSLRETRGMGWSAGGCPDSPQAPLAEMGWPAPVSAAATVAVSSLSSRAW
jgi:hypothetical protein